MALRIRSLVFLSVLAAVLVAPLSAQEAAPAGDAKRGHDLSYTCNGCHAIPNYKNVYPTYSVPKLHGQRPQYLVAALKEYRSGDRSHGTMHAQASSLSDQDMADIAAYFAGENVMTVSKSDTPAGAAPPKALETCKACHGTNGVGITPDYPSLAGQHADYIARALIEYQKGGRKNPIMMGMVTSLTLADIEAVSAYYSSQPAAVEVITKRNFWFSAK
jgi:cytochrome c553